MLHKFYKTEWNIGKRAQFIEMIRGVRIAFVDLQGFLVNRNQFVLKELGFLIIDAPNGSNLVVDTIPCYHYIFCPPFDWKYLSGSSKKHAIWLSAFHHGFYWTQGEVPYDDVQKCLAPLMEKDLIVYVKGEQKIGWLKELSGNCDIDCRNIEDDGCIINLNDYAHSDEMKHCGKHRKHCQCSLRNADIIEKWFCTNNKK